MTDALVATVKRAVDETGIAVVRSGATRAEFFALASRLGVVISELAVFVDARKSQYVRNPAAVPFHSDHHPLVDVIGWYCVQPCQSGAPNVFLDARDAYDRLSRAEQARLLDLRIGFKAADGQGRIPVVSFERGRPRFAWSPAFLEEPGDAGAREAARRFGALLEGGGGVRTISVPLQAGELVFIDNKRLLHGRQALPPDSRRMLYRLWISSDARAVRHAVGAPTAMEVLVKRPPPGI